jgi:radical SAM protein with 4Fe4S-binding SPASM domain
MNKFALKELKIEVTYNCPLACIHCSSNAGYENLLTMSKKKCMEILSDAVELGIENIAFSGGEPLIWDGIIDAVQYVSNHHLRASIYTSGNIENQTIIFTALKAAGLEKAIFSIYSSKEDEHNRVTRISHSYNKTLSSIDICHSIGITPEVHFVALASNYFKLSDIVKLVETHGVKRISVLRFVPQGRGMLISDVDTLNKKQNLELSKEIHRLRSDGHDIRTGSPFNVLWLNEDPKCTAAQDRLIVAPDTTIYPCDAFKQIKAEDIVGSLDFEALDKHNLNECWTMSKYLNFIRTAILSPPQEPCASCPNFPQCKSGCIAQKYIQYESLYKNPDPACLR